MQVSGHGGPHGIDYLAIVLALAPFAVLLLFVVGSRLESKRRMMRKGGLERRVLQRAAARR